jgi:hypothetical protein
MDNCTFDDYLDFQAGGHNKSGNPVILTNNNFKDFVNFFDCWYENEVTISNNKFHKGTNLLGKPHNIPVTFDKEAIIKDNIGQLDLDNEGEKVNNGTTKILTQERITTANRRLAKKRVQCLNEALCFVSSSVLADSLVLRNPLLRQAPKR